MDHPETQTAGAANELIDKLRVFAEGLNGEERGLLAALLAPGIDAAWGDGGDAGEVQGFGLDWTPGLLPSHLSNAIRHRNLRVEGW